MYGIYDEELTQTEVYLIENYPVIISDYYDEFLFEKREPLPPYKETLHPRRDWQRRPFWLRTRSNPHRREHS